MAVLSRAKGFLGGSGCLLAGVRFFYRTPRLWIYALLPMGIILLFYCLALFLLIFVVTPYLIGLLQLEPENWNWVVGSLVYSLYGVIYLTVLLAALFTGLLLLTTLYEALGSVFFDSLVAQYEKTAYGFEATKLGWKHNLSLLLQSLVFSVLTLLLSICLIFSLLIPVAGAVLPATVIGYRLGLSSLFSSAFIRGMSIRELRQKLKGARMMILGFGVTEYLLLLIPFAVVFLLPGFLLGGSMLFHKIGLDGENHAQADN